MYALHLPVQSGQSHQNLLQMVNGIKEVLVGNKKEFFQENFSLYGKRLVRAERWNTLLQNIPRLLIEMSSIVSMLLALLVALLMGTEVSGLIPTLRITILQNMSLLMQQRFCNFRDQQHC